MLPPVATFKREAGRPAVPSPRPPRTLKSPSSEKSRESPIFMEPQALRVVQTDRDQRSLLDAPAVHRVSESS